MRSKRSVVLDLDQPDDRARLDDLLAAADVLVHNHGPTRAARARPRRCRTGRAPPATHRLVGALVAGQPPRRRSPGERAPGHGAPGRPRRAAGLPGRPDLPPLPDRQLVRRTPQRDRHPRPPDRPPAHRARRAGAHQHRPGRTGADGDALATRGTARHRPWRSGMPKAQTGASLFECGDGVWLHLMGEPTKSPLFRDAMAEVRPEGQRKDANVLFGHVRRLGRSAAAAPERRVAGDLLGQRRARAARAASRRDLLRRAGAGERLRHRGRPSRPRPDRDGGIAPDRRPADAHASVRTGARSAHRRGVQRVEAARAGAFRARHRRRAPLAARGREGGRRGRVPRRSARAHAPRRPRRRRGEGRAAGRRRDALGRVVVLRVPTGQAGRGPRPQVAGRPPGDRRAAGRGRRPAPQPAHAGRAPPRDRRSVGPRGQPRHHLLPRQLLRPARPACRLARLRPAVPVVVRLGGGGRRRGQPADVASPRVHGPPVRDGLVDLDAARAVPPRPHGTRRSSPRGRCWRAAS